MIYEDDISWYESERMDDTDDGGGRMTATVIVDGQENNIFPDISSLERVFGGVKVRKIFSALKTDNTDALFDPHFIISERPDDPYTNVLLFSTDSWTDRLPDIKNRIEQYLAQGPKYPGMLYDLQVKGSRIVTLYQSEDTSLPSPGDVLLLVYHEGLSDEYSEYVRIDSLDSVVRSFTTYENGSEQNFKKRVVTLTLSQGLNNDYPGVSISKYDNKSPSSIIRYTVFADAAKYYGIAELANPVSIGETSIDVDSIFQSLIPSAQQEIPVGGLVAGSNQEQLIQSGPTRRWLTSSSGTVIYLGGPVYPGSISVAGTLAMSDTRAGLIGSGQTAAVDYQQGIIYFPLAGTWTIDAAPAADVTGAAFTHAIPVTLGNRGYVWTYTLPILPAPGTVTVDFLALGSWYRLSDDGAGRLFIESGGSGTISYQTGLITITLTALPDVDSKILIAWSAPTYYRRWDNPLVPAPAWKFQLPPALTPGEISATWTDGSVKNLADNGSGLLAGDATGSVDYVTGIALVRFSSVPSTPLAWSFEKRTPVTGQLTLVSAGNTINFVVPGAPLEPAQIYLVLPVERYNTFSSETLNLSIRDDGAGALIDTLGWISAGEINYSDGTGSITILDQVP